MSSRPSRSSNRKKSSNVSSVAARRQRGEDPSGSNNDMSASSSSAAAAATSRRKARLRSDFDTLDKEMELVGYGKNDKGQNRRKMPRKQLLQRTKKRKVLEKEDVKERAIEAEKIRPKRLRGSRVAFADEVVKGSMIIGGVGGDEDDDGNLTSTGSGDGSADEAWGYEQQSEQYDAGDASGVPHASAEASLHQTSGSRSPAGSSQSLGQRRGSQRTRQDDLAEAKNAVKKGKANISRVMYRLKNFKSHKLVERQGQALGAHARGEHKDAIRKLGEVASAAPLAPQVYSTLGLVYENMLHEKNTADADVDAGHDSEQGSADQDGPAATEMSEGKRSVYAKLEIAKKAYGSYHIAAVMCKKDFTLWVRAADAALEIADMYNNLLGIASTTSGDASSSTGDGARNVEVIEFKEERRKWMEEAKDDFTAADNLQPPGISIPAKLASVQMELGNLSEALTIITDLKNQSQHSSKRAAGERSELDRSYGAWLLYADLMLRIGHECGQWIDGNSTNNNYMFRRWLRKYSETFDWKERRLQALCMALEGAAGSTACTRLVEWLHRRALERRHDGNEQDKDDSGGFDSDRWHVDTYESDQKGEQVAQDDADGKSTSDSAAETEASSSAAKSVASMRKSEQQALSESPQALFEKERESLLSKNKAELLAFDQETTKMNLEPTSREGREREQLRAELVKNQRSSVVALVGGYHQKQASAEHLSSDETHSEKKGVTDSNTAPLPMSASCATVCDIAALLMKQCIILGLYHASTLVGEAVSSYFRERVNRRDRKLAKNASLDITNQQFALQSIFQMHSSYDDVDAGDESDTEDSVIDYISDDDDLESPLKAVAIDDMRNGALPDELQALCGISMIGEGGKDYVGVRALSAIASLDTSEPVENHGGNGSDRAWTLFSQSLAGATTKPFAVALLADIIDKMDERRQCQLLKLIEVFEDYIDYLQKGGLIDDVITADIYSKSDARGQRKARYMKVLHALLNLNICKEKLESSTQAQPTINAPMALLDFVVRFEDVLWTGPSPGGSITQSDVKVMQWLWLSFITSNYFIVVLSFLRSHSSRSPFTVIFSPFGS